MSNYFSHSPRSTDDKSESINPSTSSIRQIVDYENDPSIQSSQRSSRHDSNQTDFSSSRIAVNDYNYKDSIDNPQHTHGEDRINLVVANKDESVIHIHSTSKEIDISLSANSATNSKFSTIEIYQETPEYKIISKYYSDSDGANKKSDQINIKKTSSNLSISVSDAKTNPNFSYSANNVNMYQRSYNKIDSRKNIFSLPILRNFYSIWKSHSSVRKRSVHPIQTEKPNDLAGPSGIHESSDNISFESAVDYEPNILDTIRTKNKGPSDELIRLIIQQGLLLDNNQRQVTLNAYRGETIVAKNDYQPPPPYDVKGDGRRLNNPQNVGQQTPDLPPYSRTDPRNIPRGVNPADYDEDAQAFLNKSLRKRFVQRVYAILTAQLSLTVAFVLMCLYIDDLNDYVSRDWIGAIVSMVVVFILIIIMCCFEGARRTYPINFILLFGITACMSYLAGFGASWTSEVGVLMSLGVTALATLSVSLFACFSKFDITKYSWVLAIATTVLMLYGMVAMLVGFLTQSWTMNYIYSGIAVMLALAYIIFDTQLIVGGRRYELSLEEYIYGTLALYMDIIMLLMNLMHLAR